MIKTHLLWTRNVSTVSTVTGIGAILVAKGRNVVAFGLASPRRVSRRRISKVSTVASRMQCLRFLQRVLPGCESIDSERRSWKDLSGTSRQKCYKDVPKASRNARLYADRHSGSWLLADFS